MQIISPFNHNQYSIEEIKSSVDKSMTILNKYKNIIKDYNKLLNQSISRYDRNRYLISIYLNNDDIMNVNVRPDFNLPMSQLLENEIHFCKELKYEKCASEVESIMHHIFDIFIFAEKMEGIGIKEKLIEIQYYRRSDKMFKIYPSVYGCQKHTDHITNIIQTISVDIEEDLRYPKIDIDEDMLKKNIMQRNYSNYFTF